MDLYILTNFMKIVVLDGYTLNPGDLSWEGMSKLGKLTVYDRTLPSETVDRAKNAEALFTNKIILDGEVISQLPGLKFIGVLATGYNIVDVEAARQKGIVVTNIPAYSTDSVAQLVFAHILNFCNRVELHATEVKNGKWTGRADFSYQSTPQVEIAGKTLGIIGFGQIGKSVACIGNAFGMKIIFYNRSIKTEFPAWCLQTDMENIFRESDFLSINCPLTAGNRGFINLSLLKLMKPTSFLINTGRGLLISEPELAEALNKSMIAGAGLDVLSSEPPTDDNPLLTARNCFITPHIAWATVESRKRLMKTAVENLKAYIDGKPQNVVS